MAVEVTVVLRFENPPLEEDMRAALEEEFDCSVIEYEEDEV